MEINAFALTEAAYSVNETCQLLSLGRNTLYALVAAGDLPIIKVGKRSLFSASDIATFSKSIAAALAAKVMRREPA